MRRAAALAALLVLAAAIALGGCREEKRPQDKPSDEELALLREKGDEKVAAIVTGRLPAVFAALVVFRSDAYLYHSAMLEQRDIPVLNVFGNAAILRLKGPEVPLLLVEPAVRKVRYLCGPGALVRFEPTFEMELLRRYGDNREADNVSFRARFRETPTGADEKFVAAAGFAVDARAGAFLFLTGPLSGLPRLLEHEGIAHYEGGVRPAPR